MRFVSPYAKFKLRVIPQKVEQLASGEHRVIKNGYFAEFEPNAFTERERDLAIELWGPMIRKGSRMLDETLTMPAPQTWRIGTWDSKQMIHDPELREQVEKLMLEHPRYGRSFAAVPEEVIPRPWPKYDDLNAGGRGRTKEQVATEIAEKVDELGLDRDAVARYERANKNRPEVLLLLETPVEEETEDRIEVEV